MSLVSIVAATRFLRRLALLLMCIGWILNNALFRMAYLLKAQEKPEWYFRKPLVCEGFGVSFLIALYILIHFSTSWITGKHARNTPFNCFPCFQTPHLCVIKRNHGLKITRDYFLEVKCNHRLNHFLCGNAIAERSCFGIAS